MLKGEGMIESVVRNLKTKEILSNSDLAELRQYISEKYSDYSQEQHAIALASAIKTVIDNNLAQFNEGYRKTIREAVLKKTTYKSVFSIDAEELFTSCLILKKADNEFIFSLTSWLNDVQDIKVSTYTVGDFIEKTMSFSEDIIQYNLEAVICKINEAANAILNYEEKTRGKFYAAYKDKIIENALKIMRELGIYIKGAIELLGGVRLKGIKLNSRLLISISLSIACIVLFSFYSRGTAAASSQMLQNEAAFKEMLSTDYMLNQYLNRDSNVTEYLYDIEEELNIELRYKSVDAELLKVWLEGKDSILSESPYFEAIIDTAKEFDIDPLFMFAITGQEQSFVPRSNKYAKKIANNPFNVYGSWRDYNTDIFDSAAIAARTIINLGKKRPFYRDPIEWINRKYAEDKEWWVKVRIIFNSLQNAARLD